MEYLFTENYAAIVTVRALSTRLEKKCFKKLHEDLSMVQIVVERAKKIGCKVILATSSDTSDFKKFQNLENKLSSDFEVFKYHYSDKVKKVRDFTTGL